MSRAKRAKCYYKEDISEIEYAQDKEKTEKELKHFQK